MPGFIFGVTDKKLFYRERGRILKIQSNLNFVGLKLVKFALA